MMCPRKVYRTIPQFPQYEASECGQIRRKPPLPPAPRKNPDGTLSQHSSRKGYLRVIVGRKVIEVHRLMAWTWLGPVPDGMQVNHKDGRKTNNHVSNLEYVTSRENQLHAIRSGLCRDIATRAQDRAEKLTEDSVRAILALEGRHTQREIARQFGVCLATVNHIFRGRLWSHITGRKVDAA